MNQFKVWHVALALTLSGCGYFSDQPETRTASDLPPDSLLTLPPLPDTSSTDAIIATDSVGPLGVRGRFFTVLLQKERYGQETHLRRLQIRDELGKPHHDERFDPSNVDNRLAWTVSVKPIALRGERGQGIALFYEYLPSAPLSGVVVQAFGMQGARLAPIGPKLTVNGEFAELQPSQQPNIEFLGPDETLEVNVARGYFRVVVPVALRLVGCTTATQPCIRPTSARADAATGLPLFRVIPSAMDAPPSDTTLALYERPGGTNNVTVPVLRTSNVEIFEAAAEPFFERERDTIILNTRNEWLRVRIDGREGWIHGENSFQAIGLRVAG